MYAHPRKASVQNDIPNAIHCLTGIFVGQISVVSKVWHVCRSTHATIQTYTLAKNKWH